MAIERVTTVLLVRHGRTALNAQGRFRGLTDPPLDEMGMAEAEEAARSILARSRDRPIAALATSPLARARQTAESIGLAIAAGSLPFDVAGDPRVRILRLEEQVGAGAARVGGGRRARGEGLVGTDP
jgi:broad specificity phosphatase PhoE